MSGFFHFTWTLLTPAMWTVSVRLRRSNAAGSADACVSLACMFL